jgi:hypothetical protein
VEPELHPTQLAPNVHDLSGTAARRNLFCGFYNTCLSTAVRQGWSDWTCARCELRNATPAPSASRFAQDRRRDD